MAALNITGLKRVFKFGKIDLKDPDPNTYPELTTSNVHGPKVEGDKAVYEFKTTVGTKG